jgi:hypothetical protein
LSPTTQAHADDHNLYINGELDISDTTQAGSTFHYQNTFQIGARLDNTRPSYFFEGSIDSPFVISQALTAYEIKDLHLSPPTHFGLNNTGIVEAVNDTNTHVYTLTATDTLTLSQSDTLHITSSNPLTGSQYLRLENQAETDALTIDWVAVTPGSSEDTTTTLSTREEQTKTPIGYWQFNEGQGTTAKDSSATVAHGTITGATWQTEDMCISGKCLYFDGVNNRVNVGNNDIYNLTGDFTLSAWIRPMSAGGGGFGRIFSRLSSTPISGYYLYMVGGSPSNSIRFRIYNSGDGTQTITSLANTIQINNWQHLQFVRSGSTGKFFLNGKEVMSGAANELIGAPGVNLFIGGSPGTIRSFHGFIDEVKIYDYARTNQEILLDYNAGKGRAEAVNKGAAAVLGNPDTGPLSDGLVGYWKMDEASWNGTAGEVKDGSGNGNHGTSVGSSTIGSGKFGNSGTFAGSNENYVNLGIPNSLSASAPTKTVSAWINVKGGESTWRTIVGTTNGRHFHYQIQSSNRLEVYFYGPGRGTTSTTLFNFANYHKWIHVVGVWDGKNAKVYVNGIEENRSADGSGSVNSATENLYIGQGYALNRPFNGSIDEVRIYNRALAPAEVKQLYEWAPGPVASYSFDEGRDSTINDSSGYGNNGSVFGATFTNGKMGKALRFDGSSHYAEIPNAPSINFVARPYTINAWINLSSLPDGFRRIFDKSQAGTGNGYGLDVSKDYIRMLGSTNMAFLNPNLSTNTWYFITATYDGETTGQIYVNGELKKTATYTALNPHVGTAQIGKASDATAFFPGMIDEVTVYNYARAPAQIQADYQLGIIQDISANPPPPLTMGSSTAHCLPGDTSPCSAPIAEWTFDEGSGNTVADRFRK